MKKLIYFQIILSVFSVLPAFSQKEIPDSSLIAVDTLQQDFGLFTNDEILNLSLRFDMTQYVKKKPKDEYMTAILTYHINDKDSINKTIRLKSRGEFRNGYCDFPPLRLNFKQSDFQKADLKKIEKIKMVTHCEYGNEDYLFREFITYKLYNILTDFSFRVRLVKIDYINTAKKNKTISTYSFFIEPVEGLAERTGAVPVESTTLSLRNIIPGMLDRMAIFNYMIGNNDWSIAGQHNCKILSVNDFNHPGLGAVVPYDFDYSGLVNSHYAVAREELGLKSIRDRRYLGLSRTDDEFFSALKEFSDKKSEFYRVINEFPYLDQKSKKDITGYLDEFFSDFGNGYPIVRTLSAEGYK